MSLLFANEYFARFAQFNIQELARSWILPEHIPILIRNYRDRDLDDERFPPHQMMVEFLEYHRPEKDVAIEIFQAALRQKANVTSTYRILRTRYPDIAEEVLLDLVKGGLAKGQGYVSGSAIELLGEIGIAESLELFRVEAYKESEGWQYQGLMQQAIRKIEERLNEKE